MNKKYISRILFCIGFIWLFLSFPILIAGSAMIYNYNSNSLGNFPLVEILMFFQTLFILFYVYLAQRL